MCGEESSCGIKIRSKKTIPRRGYGGGFFLNNVAICWIIVIFAENYGIMIQETVGLNEAQLDFLRLLAHFTTKEEVSELNDLVCEYYARKVD